MNTTVNPASLAVAGLAQLVGAVILPSISSDTVPRTGDLIVASRSCRHASKGSNHFHALTLNPRDFTHFIKKPPDILSFVFCTFCSSRLF